MFGELLQVRDVAAEADYEIYKMLMMSDQVYEVHQILKRSNTKKNCNYLKNWSWYCMRVLKRF